MTLDEHKNNLKTLFATLLHIRKKMRGRDDTILTVLTYENFEEFYDAQSPFWIMPFSTDSQFFKAVFKNFFTSQLSCILLNKTREEQFKMEDFIYEVVEENLSDFIAILKLKYPKLEKALRDTNAQNKGAFTYTLDTVNDEFSVAEVA